MKIIYLVEQWQGADVTYQAFTSERAAKDAVHWHTQGMIAALQDGVDTGVFSSCKYVGAYRCADEVWASVSKDSLAINAMKTTVKLEKVL